MYISIKKISLDWLCVYICIRRDLLDSWTSYIFNMHIYIYILYIQYGQQRQKIFRKINFFMNCAADVPPEQIKKKIICKTVKQGRGKTNITIRNPN